MEQKFECPFVYANGKKCGGFVFKWRVYGKTQRNGRVRPEHVRKIRLWCTEKNDHAGILHTFEAKTRMEFYPDQLPDHLYEAIMEEEWSD